MLYDSPIDPHAMSGETHQACASRDRRYRSLVALIWMQVWVGGTSSDCKPAEVAEHFDKFGRVEEVETGAFLRSHSTLAILVVDITI